MKKINKMFSRKMSYPLAIATLCVATTTFAAVINHEVQKAPDSISSDNAVTVDNFTTDGAIATNSADELVWSRCLVGQSFENNTCTGEPTEFASWDAALNAPTAEQITDGWRVPNIKELIRITDNTYAYPATNSEVFGFASMLKFAEDDGYGGGARSPSTPYIWSSTPIAHKLITKDANYNDLTAAESATQSEASRQEMMKTYALDLMYGDSTPVYRDGRSIGEADSTQYYKPDPDNVKKARYVLLVKNG